MEPFLFAPLHAAPPPVAGVLYAEDFDLLDDASPFAGKPGIMHHGLDLAEIRGTETDGVPVQQAPPLTESDLEEARREARAEGAAAALAAAEQQAAQDAASSSRRALAALADALSDARAEGARLAEDHAEAVARLVLSALAASLPATCARHGESEVRALVGALLPHLEAEPQVVIRCSPHDAGGLRAELERLGPAAPASVQVTPTDAVAQGDVRVTWQGGGASRDARRAWDAVRDALAPLGLIDAAEAVAAPSARPAAPQWADVQHMAARTAAASAAAGAVAGAATPHPALQKAEMEDA